MSFVEFLKQFKGLYCIIKSSKNVTGERGNSMATKIDVDLVKLKGDYDSCVEKIDDLDEKMSAIDTDVQEMGEMWEGPSHDAFLTAFQNDYSLYQDFKIILQNSVSALENARQAYIQCENANIALAEALPD